METRTYNVYKFEELSEEQQKKVIEKHRDINVDFQGYDETTLEDLKDELEKLGFSSPEISYSGFWSQGDGASFTCTDIDILKFLKEKKLVTKYRECKKDIEEGEISASIYRNTHHYSHENSCSISIDDYHAKASDKILLELENELEKARLELCEKIYKRLESEYDYLTSDEVVKETLLCNDYDFTIYGKID